jgi:hypothetical protein
MSEKKPNKDTIEGILFSLENEIVQRVKGMQIIETDYPGENGMIPSSLYPEYKKRKDEVEQRFSDRWIGLLNILDSLCKQIRSRQPDLCELSESNINTNRSFPRNVVLGRINVTYRNMDIYVPRTVEFPIKKPVYINDDKDNVHIHRLLLRLLFALPVGKTELTIFDPNGLGSAVDNFRELFGVENVFPHKKVLSTQKELKQMLTEALAYCEGLIQNTFSKDCDNWADYNRLKYSQGSGHKNQMLSYKIFGFFNVPSGMDGESFEMFRKLAAQGERLGILVLFSYNPSELADDKFYQNSLVNSLLKFITNNSAPLYNIINVLSKKVEVNHLSLREMPERFPTADRLEEMLAAVKNVVLTSHKDFASFEDLMDLPNLFNDNTIERVAIPLGVKAVNGEKVTLELGDNPPHALIGGTTGSGKSTFLHNMILSACCRFSPNELNIYLLDFKSGVEFSVYAVKKLPHARLVAVEADIEYGISVLQHLTDENAARYKMFKNAGVSGIGDYRRLYPNDKLPRLLLVVDEFQVLFSGSNNVTTKVHEYLSVLVKQGRGAGIHIVMATQTLAGLDFGALGTQFGGRVALMCTEEDSKKILGGLNNDEASELVPGFAILNTQAGSVSGNVKFAVPFARKMDENGGEGNILKTLSFITNKCSGEHYGFETKIFNGIIMPKFPPTKDYTCNSLRLLLGEELSYSSDKFYIYFKKKPYNNVLICGSDEFISHGLLISALMSAQEAGAIKKIIYVGEDLPTDLDSYCTFDKLKRYESLRIFLAEYGDKIYNDPVLIVFNNVNATKEINYPANFYQGQTLTEEQEALKGLFDDCNTHGVFIAALFNKFTQFKTSGLPLDRFDHRIGYLLNDNDKNLLLGQHLAGASGEIKTGRAFYANNGEIVSWFKPYVGDENE